MKIIDTSTKKGLRIITSPVPTLESVTVTVWVGTGSRYESKEISGISHFLEHMAFKGGKKYKNAQAVSEAIDAIGGEFNAGTSKEWTNFYVRASKQHMEKVFDVLSDMLLSPSLRQSDIDREKGVIVEEMNMYEDTPMYKIGDVFENLYFGKKHSLGRDIIGTKKTVTSLTRSDFKKYIATHYRANNMLITVSGGVDSKDVEKLAEKYFGSVDGSDKQDIEIFSKNQNKPQVFLKNKKVDQVHLVLGFNGIPLGNNDRYVESVLATILGGGMSSRLFTEVREKRGLAYSVRADQSHYLDVGYVGAQAGLDPKRIDEAIKVILGEFYSIANRSKKITSQELKKAKEYMRGHLALSLESTKSINGFIGHEAILLGKVRTIEEVYQGIDSVTTEDLYRYAQEHFVPETLNLAIIGPFKESSRFEKLLI